MWISHIDGTSFRKLGNQHQLSALGAYKIVEREMNALPLNSTLSKEYCDRWSGVLNVDGKFVQVRGYEKKIPFIYSLDYHTHDLPVGLLAPSENLEAFGKLFGLVERIGYLPKLVVGDDSTALQTALNWAFPRVPFQLCHTHYLENLREALKVRTEDKFQMFFAEFEKVFKRDKSKAERFFVLEDLEKRFGAFDRVVGWMVQNVLERYTQLFAFETLGIYAPHSNNIIESFNSHLQGRLETIKGFESWQGAERWLNAWMIRRRIKPFTDCEKPFLHLNGKCGLEMSIKNGKKFPKFQ